MSWAQKLKELLRPFNRSELAREFGWPAQRISQMVGREEIPNVVDAVILCQRLGVTVESVFGDEARLRIKLLNASVKDAADLAEATVLTEAAQELISETSKAHKGKPSGRAKDRKTGT